MAKVITKQDRVLAALRGGLSLNRFEAALDYGDWVLPTSVARLRARGFLILGTWEKVPTRWGADVRCMRYAYIGNV